MIRINRSVEIPEHEISYRFSKSSKPGGQNVNKVSSRVTLFFDVEDSETLSEAQRVRIMEKLASRISKSGVLTVVSQKYRTQKANREAALERFKELLREALKRRRKRKRTAVPREVKERRLRTKKLRSRLKRGRAHPSADED